MPYITHQERARLQYRSRAIDKLIDVFFRADGQEIWPFRDERVHEILTPFREERAKRHATFAMEIQVHADQSSFDKVPR